MHKSRLAALVIDCRTDDLLRQARFWSGALGYPIVPPEPDWDGKYIVLAGPDGEAKILLQRAWDLERLIDNQARMVGSAVFTALGGGRLIYEERGELHLASGQTFAAERRYFFEPCETGFSILFAEEPPRLFQNVVLAEVNEILAGEAEHVCGNDSYRSRYEFLPDGSFSIRHVVRGPRKRYAMVTRYRRNCATDSF